MTFYEAAVAVLRDAGRPLHYKKIAEISVRKGLLSHVGRTPEATMSARLTQEAKKAASDAVIHQVRPGVFGIRDGVDADDARETIVLHQPSEEAVAERRARAKDAEPGPEAQMVDAPREIPKEDGDRKRRRRGRRGSRSRDGEIDESGSSDAAEAPTDDARDGDAGTTGAKTAVTGDEVIVRDIARAVADILRSAPRRRPLSASKVSSMLVERKVGALGPIGPTALRDALTQANQRRADAGRPPLFEETKPNFWALAAATGTSLAASYDALDTWQDAHRNALSGVLTATIGKLDGDAIGTIATLLLDRMGYTSLERHEPVGAELCTLSACSPRSLACNRVAIRVHPADKTAQGDDVQSLRDGLQSLGAAQGVVMAFGKVDDGARDAAGATDGVPITLLDLNEIVEHLIANGVGVDRFSVDVSCVDDAFFRELD